MPEHLGVNNYILLTIIVDRNRSKGAVDALSGMGVYSSFAMPGRGTASSAMLAILGLGDTKKDIVLSTLRESEAETVLRTLIDKCKLDKPGHGIAFTISLDTVLYGRGLCKQENFSTTTDRGENMNGCYELILAAANSGFSDAIMEAARTVHPVGGTIMKGRETGLKDGETFFGVQIQPEKELVLMIVPKERTEPILQAIMENAPPNSKAGTFAVALPVRALAGLSPAMQ